MRILLTADPFVPVPPQYYGGIERIIAGLIVKLREWGHEIGLVAHPDSTAPTDHLFGWRHPNPTGLQQHAENARCLLKASREFGPSLVHSFSRILYLSALLCQRIPKLMSYQRIVAGRTVRLSVLLGGKSITFTGCSQFIASMGVAQGGTWHAIPNFVDTDLYEFSPTVASNAPLVFLSRIESIKGTHLAIDAAKKTGRRLLVAGNYATAGPERDYWDSVIKPQLGKDGVEYVGPVDDRAKVNLLKSAAAMIVPIQWDEPFGIVFAESLACGTPVISCPRGALPEIVREGVDGFLVRNSDETCRAVAAIGQIKRIACRQRAETSFSAGVVSRRYQALYESLIAQA